MSTQTNNFRCIIEYATKAPSGHNTQPWLFKIENDVIEIHPNLKLSLTAVDNNNREMYISLGCTLQNLCIAAQNFGYTTTPTTCKSSVSHYIRVKLTKEKIYSNPLFTQIEIRQTNRSIYNGKTVDTELIAALFSKKHDSIKCHIYANGQPEFNKLQSIVLLGNTIQMGDNNFKTELLQWIRYNAKHSESQRNGLSNSVMGSPSLPLFLARPIVKLFLNSESQNTSGLKKIRSSSHLVLLTVAHNTPEMWIELGQELELLLLTCSQHNIAAAFLNQPCEIEELTSKVQLELNFTNESPAILLRIGYARPMPYSLRKNVNDVII